MLIQIGCKRHECTERRRVLFRLRGQRDEMMTEELICEGEIVQREQSRRLRAGSGRRQQGWGFK